MDRTCFCSDHEKRRLLALQCLRSKAPRLFKLFFLRLCNITITTILAAVAIAETVFLSWHGTATHPLLFVYQPQNADGCIAIDETLPFSS